MRAITLLCFLLMIQNVCLKRKDQKYDFQTGSTAYPKVSRCLFEEVIAKEIREWNKTDKFQVYTPKRSCFICAMAKCQMNPCESTFNVTKMNIYNNLFEFGLFAFRMAKTNIFKIMINSLCYFKVEILPNMTAERQTEIFFFECLTGVGGGKDKCTEKLAKNPPRSFRIKRDCIFVAFAFVMKKKLHYSLTFDCTNIPGLLLNESVSINITSNKCFIDKEKKNLTAQFIYEENAHTRDGMILMLPCTTGGFSFDDRTGHMITGDTCKTFMTNDTYVKGMEFVSKNLFNKNPFRTVESRPKNWDQIIAKEKTIEKYTPIYVNPREEWKSQVDIENIIKNITVPKNKVRQGCKLVDASKVAKVTKGPPHLTPPAKPLDLPLQNEDKVPKTEFDITKKKGKGATKKTKISGLGGGADTSRGSLNFLSIKMKLIMFASNLGIIYHM